jgi:Fic-DOC domain mobile mystery protein B
MGLILNYLKGQTPIDEEEKEGLKILTISSQSELNEFEQLNIENALQWIYSKKLNPSQLFNEKFICQLHHRMFGNVWSWAGKFRKTNKNLGVAPHQIAVQLKTLCDDALFWIENGTYAPDEIAIRFKHRIVSIHCFSNGNGRHSRLLADIVIEKLFSKKPFTWGSTDLTQGDQVRKCYLAALKAADLNHFEPLLAFSRT